MCALVLTHTSQTNAEHGKRKVSHEAYGWGLLVRCLFNFGLDIAQDAVFRCFFEFPEGPRGKVKRHNSRKKTVMLSCCLWRHSLKNLSRVGQ